MQQTTEHLPFAWRSANEFTWVTSIDLHDGPVLRILLLLPFQR